MTQLRSIDGVASAAEAGMDQDGDAAFFELSSAGAEQVTIQIRSMMERAWEYIAIAYQGRAHLALGYESWDQYVDDRLGDLRLTVPRERRGAVVQSLSKAQMSLRAIAKVLGVSVATVSRAASSGAAEPSASDEESAPIKVRGRDGRLTAGSTPSAGRRQLTRARSVARRMKGRPTSAPGICSHRGEDLGRVG